MKAIVQFDIHPLLEEHIKSELTDGFASIDFVVDEGVELLKKLSIQEEFANVRDVANSLHVLRSRQDLKTLQFYFD